MIWLAIGFDERMSLGFSNGSQNHKDCIRLLESEFLPYCTELGGEDWIFPQEGAVTHFAAGVKNWFYTNKFSVLQRPSKSPD